MAPIKLADVGKNLALYKGHPDDLKEQDVNAHVMPPEMLEQLAQNIKGEERLESLPFAHIKTDGSHELISGHHRKRAAVMAIQQGADMTDIFWLADTRELSRSKVVAKQLAHNSIVGEDDKQTLKRLYDEIDDVNDKIESFLRPEDFDDVKQLEPASVTDISVAIPWKHLTLVFTPSTMEALDRIDGWVKRTPKETDILGVVSVAILDRFRAAAISLGRTEDVRSLGAIMTRMTEIVEQHIAEHEPKQPEDTSTARVA